MPITSCACFLPTPKVNDMHDESGERNKHVVGQGGVGMCDCQEGQTIFDHLPHLTWSDNSIVTMMLTQNVAVIDVEEMDG
jgi:hypothetical protein